MPQRRRFKQLQCLKDRLTVYIRVMQERADIAQPGPERGEVLKKVRSAQAALEIDGWTNSRDLQPPK
jgi:hypothetical protein